MRTKRVLKKMATMGGDILLLVSLIAALASIPSIVIIITKTKVFASWTLLTTIGLLILGVSIVRTIADCIYGLIYKEKKITALIGIKDSIYDHLNLAEGAKTEIIFGGQNLTHLINSEYFFDVIEKSINASTPKQIKIILNLPFVLKYIAYETPAAMPNLYIIAKKIHNFLNSLSESAKDRVKVYFHEGISGLSFTAIDRDTPNGIFVCNPKFTNDGSPGDRIYGIVEKWENEAIFKNYNGKIDQLISTNRMTLEQVLNWYENNDNDSYRQYPGPQDHARQK